MGTNLSTFSFKLIKILIFIILVSVTLHFLGKFYSDSAGDNKVNLDNQKRFDQFYETPKNSLDLIFIGSSHSYCSFDPEIFNAELGIKSFQMGMPLQHPDCTYYTLLEILNYQKPKRIVMELYSDMLDDEFDLTQINMLLDVIKNDELKDRILKEVFPINEKIKYNFNVARFQTSFLAKQNKNLMGYLEEKYQVKKETAQIQGTSYYKDKGYIFSDTPLPKDEYDKTNQFKNIDGKNFKINKTQKQYLEKIIWLCKQNQIELIFVTAPIANISLELFKNYDNVTAVLKDFSTNNNISYYDFNLINRSENLLTDNNFRDDAHLNHSGATVISKELCKILK